MTELQKFQTDVNCTHPRGSDDCYCDLPEKLLALADEPWFELLKETINSEIYISCGSDMDKLEKMSAVNLGEHQVGKKDVNGVLFQQSNTFFAVIGF